MFFSFRNKRAFSFGLSPSLAIMFYHLAGISHMLQHSVARNFAHHIAHSSMPVPDLHFEVVVAFLVEMALFVILRLIGEWPSAPKARRRKLQPDAHHGQQR